MVLDMTLNLMLTSKNAVYLSADFRLTSVSDGTALPDNFDAQKLIPVVRPDWAALIAYVGIASAPPLINDMGQWIIDQVDSIRRDGTPSDLLRRLLRLNSRLERIRGDRRVTFSVVGFRDQRPFMMLLSNFVDFEGRLTEPGPHLIPHLRTPNQPEVRCVGTVRPDVFERVRLERLLRASSSRKLVPQLVGEAVAEINASAARRSHGSISEECVSGYLLRSGLAVISGHGIPDHARCFPNWVRKDLEKQGIIGFERLKPIAAEPLPIQWKAMSARILKNKLVRVHEIANSGKPILASQAAEADDPGYLRYLLKHTALMKRDRLRRSANEEISQMMVLVDATSTGVFVVKYGRFAKEDL